MNPFTGKIFPLRLPPNFHGASKQYKKAREIYKERKLQNPNPEAERLQVLQRRKHRLNKNVEAERQEFLISTGRISKDTPDWFKSTSHWFYRSAASRVHRETRAQQEQYTVLNQLKTDSFCKTTPIPRAYSSYKEVTPKVGSQTYTKSWINNHSNVSDKVGTVDIRDFTVRRPSLKIGSLQPNNFIDTYQK